MRRNCSYRTRYLLSLFVQCSSLPICKADYAENLSIILKMVSEKLFSCSLTFTSKRNETQFLCKPQEEQFNFYKDWWEPYCIHFYFGNLVYFSSILSIVELPQKCMIILFWHNPKHFSPCMRAALKVIPFISLYWPTCQRWMLVVEPYLQYSITF